MNDVLLIRIWINVILKFVSFNIKKYSYRYFVILRDSTSSPEKASFKDLIHIVHVTVCFVILELGGILEITHWVLHV